MAIKLKVREALSRYQDSFPDDERPTQVRIAVEAGINPATLSHYVTGKVQRPDLTLMGQLCRYLGIEDMNEIFELIEDEEATP